VTDQKCNSGIKEVLSKINIEAQIHPAAEKQVDRTCRLNAEHQFIWISPFTGNTLTSRAARLA
jgi:hypothetical protein